MNTKTVIGGTTYESVGSSSSNLLLKCNGTARIQWGNKLIDLIKNGKLASDGANQIKIVSDESEITQDGLYVLNKDNNSLLYAYKSGQIYNLAGTDLYISATKKQEITAEQQTQALQNIGLYYNSLDEAKTSGIQNGIIYVSSTKTLYTVLNGKIEEFEAKLKTITVEKNNEKQEGEVINSSFKIVLSVLDSEYLTLSDQKITANYSIHVDNSAQIGSESADSYKGYRLYMEGDVSCLDVDKINVRQGIQAQEYVKETFNSLTNKVALGQLVPHQWYLITDFQNHWKLPIYNINHNRPILLRALTNNTFYKQGQLFKDRRVIIEFDMSFQEPIKQTINKNDVIVVEEIKTRGRITKMIDGKGNEANFDFLDYTDADGNPLTTLHFSEDSSSLDKSIFPKYTYNNKLTVHDLFGTVLLDQQIVNDNTTSISFNIDDSELTYDGSAFEMHDNELDCYGLIVEATCNKFYGNKINQLYKGVFSQNFTNNTINLAYNTSNNSTGISQTYSEYTNVYFNQLINNSTFNNLINSIINNSVYNSIFEGLERCVLNTSFNNVNFKYLTACTFNTGSYKSAIENATSYSPISDYTFTPNNSDQDALYDSSKVKSIYYIGDVLYISVTQEQTFFRGMIVMHAGTKIGDIPVGWAVCDGNEYTYEGVTSKTPNLIGQFIKGTNVTQDDNNIKAVTNPALDSDNNFTLQEKHLPAHSHPHKAHSHTFSGSDNCLTTATGIQIATGTDGTCDDVSSGSVTISGTTGNQTSVEQSKTWTNESFKLEPNYYALIFIMKL